MPSPFPGVDPYIEATGSWKNFHNLLIGECEAYLNARLPEDYVARSDERVQLYDDDGTPNRQVEPDALVARRRPHSPPAFAAGSGGVATLEPRTLPQGVPWLEMPVETYLEVLHYPEERVVTTLEILLPTNKVGPGFDEYALKRRDVLCAGVNLLEIDLLLGGRRIALEAPLPAGNYHAFLTRQSRRDSCDVYSWSVRDALPTVPVPLRPEDGDVALDLAAVFTETYDRGVFARKLARRYAAGPPPLLSEADRAWAAGLGLEQR